KRDPAGSARSPRASPGHWPPGRGRRSRSQPRRPPPLAPPAGEGRRNRRSARKSTSYSRRAIRLSPLASATAPCSIPWGQFEGQGNSILRDPSPDKNLGNAALSDKQHQEIHGPHNHSAPPEWPLARQQLGPDVLAASLKLRIVAQYIRGDEGIAEQQAKGDGEKGS